jgi:hypothetical protein
MSGLVLSYKPIDFSFQVDGLLSFKFVYPLLWYFGRGGSAPGTASDRSFSQQGTVVRRNFPHCHVPGNPFLDPRIKPIVLVNDTSSLPSTSKCVLGSAPSDFH